MYWYQRRKVLVCDDRTENQPGTVAPTSSITYAGGTTFAGSGQQ